VSDRPADNAANRFYYDLHLHSCLSPCADDDMTPCNIANMAMLCELDMAALTDHNSLKNCPAFFAAARAAGVEPVAGVELCTREEVHVLLYFPSLERAMDFDAWLAPRLPDIPNRPDIFGRQLRMGEEDAELGVEPKLLINATDIPIEETPGIAARFGGVAVPAHIDRQSNGIISNLGFVPPEYGFAAYEIKNLAKREEIVRTNPCVARKPTLSSSDAHTLTDIAERARFVALGERSAAALVDALKNGILVTG